MARKTTSTVHKTIFPEPEADDFVFDPEEFRAPEFPRRLSEPMQVDLASLLRLDQAIRSADAVAGMAAWSQWVGLNVGELRGRWADLFTFYGISGLSSEDAWKQLAIALARDFVPGLRVENISPSDTALKEQARLRAVVNEVAWALKKRREARTGEVAERTALQHDFFEKHPWRAELFGDKPDSIGTLATRFARDKEKFAKLLIEQDWRKDQVIAAFESAGLEVPSFLKDLPDLSLAGLKSGDYNPQE